MKFPLKRVCARLIVVCTLCYGACSDSDTESSSSDADAKSQVLRIISWEDYVAPEVVEAFTERTGIDVQISSFENTEDLIGTLRAYSHRHDLVIFDI